MFNTLAGISLLNDIGLNENNMKNHLFIFVKGIFFINASQVFSKIKMKNLNVLISTNQQTRIIKKTFK